MSAPRLHFRRLGHGPFQGLGSPQYWANADGTAEEQLGQPGYLVRQHRGMWQAQGPGVDGADGIVLGSGIASLREAKALCEKDLPMYERACRGEEPECW